MKRLVAYGVIGLGCYLAFLLMLMPATYAWSLAQPQLASQFPGLQLGGIEGTVWQGQAGNLVYREQPLGSLNWHLATLPLLRQQLDTRLVLQNEEAYAQGRLSTSFHAERVQLEAVEARFPIQQLTRFMSFLPVAVDGMLSIRLPSLELDANGLPRSAQGTVVWHQAGLTLTEFMPLGDLRAELSSDEEGRVHAEIRDSGSGPLKIEAQWVLEKDGRHRLQGFVSAGEGSSEALKQALGWLGKPDAQGRYRLQYNGRLG